MTETLANNAWVESYLDALLSKGGLSNEHVAAAGNSPGARGVGGARGGEGGGMFDALMDDEERSITARYYVHQILSLDEERIRDAWSKASRPAKSGGLTAERDARMEHLSWRVWAMKRRRAQ
ncbi:sucrose-phosphate synthase, partial [Haematococcus lacustris]